MATQAQAFAQFTAKLYEMMHDESKGSYAAAIMQVSHEVGKCYSIGTIKFPYGNHLRVVEEEEDY